MQAKPSTIRLDLRIGKCAVERLTDQARDVGIPLREHVYRIVQEAAERSVPNTDEGQPSPEDHETESCR